MARTKTTTAKKTVKSLPVPVNPYKDMTKTKASATFQLFRQYLFDSHMNMDPEGFDTLINKFGNSTTWVYIAVKRIADAVAQIPFQAINPTAARPVVIRNYDKGLLNILTQPNPWQRMPDFLETLMLSLELTGNVFIELVRGPNGKPFEMYVLNPARMTIIPSTKDYIAGYVFSVNGRSIGFEPEDIIHIKYPHPNNDYYGFSPLTAARVSINVDQSANEWNENFLKSGAFPVGALETDNEIGDEEYKRLSREIKRTVQTGKDQAGRLLVLTGGLKYNPLCITPKEADWLDARRMSRDEILAIFGVPYAVAGLFSTEQTTARSAGVELQIKQFYRTTIFPKVEKIISAFNRQLVPEYRENIQIVPNYRSVPALQEEVDQELTRALTLRALVGAGLSLNKSLQRLYPDIDPEAWGDVAWLQQGMMPVDGPQIPQQIVDMSKKPDPVKDGSDTSTPARVEDKNKSDDPIELIQQRLEQRIIERQLE